MVDLAQAIVHSCGSPTLRSTCQLSGALGCVMLCLTASPPLTVLSVITYLTPASTSNKTPSKTSSTTDSKPPGSRPTLQGDPGDLLDRRIGEHQVRTVEPDQLPELLDQRTLRSLKNPGEIIHAQGIQRRDHRQPPDDLGDQPKLLRGLPA